MCVNKINRYNDFKLFPVIALHYFCVTEQQIVRVISNTRINMTSFSISSFSRIFLPFSPLFISFHTPKSTSFCWFSKNKSNVGSFHSDLMNEVNKRRKILKAYTHTYTVHTQKKNIDE